MISGAEIASFPITIIFPSGNRILSSVYPSSLILYKYTDMWAHSNIQTCWHIQIYRHVGTFKYTDMLAHSNKQITDMLLNISKLDNSRTNSYKNTIDRKFMDWQFYEKHFTN